MTRRWLPLLWVVCGVLGYVPLMEIRPECKVDVVTTVILSVYGPLMLADLLGVEWIETHRAPQTTKAPTQPK